MLLTRIAPGLAMLRGYRAEWLRYAELYTRLAVALVVLSGLVDRSSRQHRRRRHRGVGG
jgi:hypothetical protein